MPGAEGQTRPYTIQDRECRTRAELAVALAEEPEAAAAHLEQGYAAKWLEEELHDYDAKIALAELLEEFDTLRAAFEFALRYAPDWTPSLRRIPLTYDAIGELCSQCRKDDRISTSPLLIMLTAEIYGWGLFTDERVTKGDTRLAVIDAAWRQEFEDFVRARGEMLLYRDFWQDHAGNLRNHLFSDRRSEMQSALAVTGEGEDAREYLERAAGSMAHAAKVELLAEIFARADPARRAASSYKVEDTPDFAQAMKCAWFAEMVSSPDKRSAGREALLREAAHIAAVEASAAEEQKGQAKEEEAKNKPLELQINALVSRLDRRMQAALFGLPVFVTLLLADTRQGNDWLWWSMLALTLTIGLVPFRLIHFGFKYLWLQPILAGLMVFFLIIYPFDRELWRSDFLYELGFAALAAAAGYFREPMLAWRDGHRTKSDPSSLANRFANTTARIDPARLRKMFFPETLFALPAAELTPAEQRFVSRTRHGLHDDMGVARHADIRSPVSPNNPDGVSMNAGGFNLGPDGNATFEVMDGVSMDTDGNWNMRVVDGVTMHSDGKWTTRVVDGVEVRSDGQVSQEFMGWRVSSGGKDEDDKGRGLFEPKKETDWFGNKKDKQWGEW